MDLVGVELLLEEVNRMGVFVYTAFNMRFHPLIRWAKKNIRVESVLEVQAYSGSYLPDWRPHQDYRENYSAISQLGGGVHLDLIHEIDYIRYLFGDPIQNTGFLNRFSTLEIDSIDSSHYWLKYSNFGVSILLNYFRRSPKRTLEIVEMETCYHFDLIKGIVKNDKGKIVLEEKFEILDIYLHQMQYFLEHIKAKKKMMNTLEESVKTLKICLDAT